MEENVLILGATSDMAVAIARQLATEGYSITLVGRSTERLSALEADLRVRHEGKEHGSIPRRCLNRLPVHSSLLMAAAHHSASSAR